jgi:hypothetical protein
MEVRAQISHHFKIDPAKLAPGLVRIPEQITRTVSVGDELTTEKVSSECLSPDDRAAILAEIEKQTREATRTARPAGAAPAADPVDSVVDDEMSAF